MNRLKLDFTIESAPDRKKFIFKYLEREEFIFEPPTPEELETIANYLLWGKTTDSEGNPTKISEAADSGIQIKTKNGTWDKKEEAESLESLTENPAFNESQISPIYNSTRYKKPRVVFSRSDARKSAPPIALNALEELWRQIDYLDLLLNYYDLAHSKRKNPPRDELLQRFTELEQARIHDKSTHINPYTYLKFRHQLVELRRQQFTIKDSYTSIILNQGITPINFGQTKLSFDSDVLVYPLGLKSTNSELSDLLFRENFDPAQYTEENLQKLSDFYWSKKEETPSTFCVDFRNLEDVYQLFQFFFDLEDQAAADLENSNVESTTSNLLATLNYYISQANLSEIQAEILQLKIQKTHNQVISQHINKKYGKSYTTNYISTIFRQKIIKKINEAATYHEKVIGNIFFPENFKKCSKCGKVLLLSQENFVKRSRSKDGFNSKCKNCEREERQLKKINKEKK